MFMLQILVVEFVGSQIASSCEPEISTVINKQKFQMCFKFGGKNMGGESMGGVSMGGENMGGERMGGVSMVQRQMMIGSFRRGY